MGFVGVVVALYFVKFGTDVLLIVPVAMRAIQALARLWDGVTDPVAGYLSDRTPRASAAAAPGSTRRRFP
jgi:Na+/melibiose symporter-like transporter